MRISKLLLCTGVLWLTVASQAGWSGTITNCAEVSQASPTDVDSTPGNFTTTPAEDDESCASLSVLENYDLGDAPDPSYPTVLATNGARHIQTGNTLHLGGCVDTDSDGNQSSTATGDDTNVSTLGTVGTCVGNDDEDGVTFNDPLQAGAQNVTITVTANQACKLNAWIDWSGNASWGDVGDQIATDQQLSAGSNTLTLNVPSYANPGATYARFRCSTAGGDGITGEAADGEVEDYRIPILAAVPKVDLKKYVQDAAGAPAYNPANEVATLGDDAQDFVSGVILPYGHDALYRIRVENTGATKLGSVTVDDQIEDCDPLNKVYDSDATSTGNTMNKGEVWVLECTLPALKQDVVNIAKVRGIPINDDGTETGQSPVDDFDPANVIIPQEQPAISLKKFVRPDGAAQASELDAQDAGSALIVNHGDAVTYRIVVTNTGNTWLADVVMDDRLAACTPVRKDSNTSDALLAPLESWIYECTGVVTTVDTYNLATVTANPVNEDGTPTNQSPVNDDDPANVRVRVNQPAINLKKYVVSGGTDYDAQDASTAVLIDSGATVSYKIVVTNPGNTVLGSVNVDDQLEGCTLSAPSGDTNNNSRLETTETWTYTCDVANVKLDTYNLATVTATPVNTDGSPTGQSPVSDEDPANVRIRVNQPAISLKKYVVTGGVDNDAQDAGKAVLITAGSTVNYKFVVTNTGNTVLGSVNVEDQLEDCTLSSVSGDTGNDGRMAPGEVWTYTCSTPNVRVDTQNYATVTATPVTTDGTPTGQSPVTDGDPANVRIQLGQPAIELKKYVRPVTASAGAATEIDAEDMSAALVVQHGASVTYRMVVRNIGNTPLVNVVLTEHMDACAVSQTVGTGQTILNPGEFWEYECTKADMTLDQENVADVQAQPANPDGTPTTQSPVRDLDPANVRIPTADPSISLKKYVVAGGTDNDAQDASTAVLITSGSTVNYKIVVTNTGSAVLGNVQVDDQLAGCTLGSPVGDTGNDSRMSIGEIWTYTCSVANVTLDTYNLATVTATPVNADDGTPTGQSPVTDEDPANVRIPLGQPAIELKKYVVSGGDKDAQDASTAVLIDAGSTVTYKIVVTNTGNTGLGSVQVDDQLAGCTLGSVQGDTGNDGRMAVGEVWTYTCNVADVRVDTYNYATVTANPINISDGTPTGQSPVSDGDPANVRIPLGQPAIELKKYVRPVAATAGSAQEKDAEDMSSALMVAHGSTVTYRMVVRNIGNTPLIDVVLTEHMAGCTVSQTVGAGQTILNSGASWEYECTKADVTADQENVADVQAQPANPDGTPTTQSPVRDLDPANVKILTADPSISLKKYVVANGTDNDAQDAATAVLIASGSTVNYKIVVTNTGSALLGSVNVDDQLAGCTLSTPAGDTGSDSRLSPAEVWTYTCSVAGVTLDTYNLATVTATPINADDGTPTGQSPVTDEDPANVRIPLGQPAIELKKYVVSGGDNDAQDASTAVLIDAGSTVNYKITVTNTGNTGLGSVNVDDQLAGCTLSSPTGDTGSDGRMTVGEMWTYTCSVADVRVDTYNYATVTATPINSSDGTPTGQSPVTDGDPANVKVRVQRPAIELKKYVVSGGDQDAQDMSTAVVIDSGSNVTYKIVVTNPGNAPLADVTVDDQLAGCTLSSPVITNNDGDNLLDSNETWTYTCTVSGVTTDLYNLATVEAKPANEDGTLTTQSPVDAEDPANVRIRDTQPGIQLKKYVTVGSTHYDAQDMATAVVIDSGADVNYTIVVTNTGNTPLANVNVDDRLDGCTLSAAQGDANANGRLDMTETWTYTCQVSAVQTDLYNLANVEALPVHDDGNPTGQSPVNDNDPANVKVRVQRPAIELKKYVVSSGADVDAQDASTAVIINSGSNVTYKIVVTNPGNAPLAQVNVDDQLEGCTLSGPATGSDANSNSLLDKGETWTYSCTVSNVTTDLYNLATVDAKPANPDGSLTTQSPVTAEDPANVRIPLGQPAIQLKKYVVSGGDKDAQDASTAVLIDAGSTVTYKIVVTNTGNTGLGSVQVDDQLAGCTLGSVQGDTGNDGRMAVGEVWIYTCNVADVRVDTYNYATVTANPINISDGTPTGQSPVSDGDPANVRIPLGQPAIELKKYVRLAGSAASSDLDAEDMSSALVVNHGANVTYHMVVTNTGNTPLVDVVLTEHMAGCSVSQTVGAGQTLFNPGDVWEYQCTKSDMTADQENVADVQAQPANPDGTPTTQSPVRDLDPANVRLSTADPSITLKKYVVANGTDNDAQDASTAVLISSGSAVTYKIVVTNTGSALLGNVQVDDQLAGCTLGSPTGDTSNDGRMLTGEVWTYTCNVANVTVDTYNLATVTATPINADDGTPTGQSPVTDEDPANVRIPLGQPAIQLKKYVQDAATAPAFSAATPLAGLGNDAQDMSSATALKNGANALYRMVVTNIGNTPLAQVVLTEHLDSCTVSRLYNGDADVKDLLSPGEYWVYQCTKSNVTVDMQNVASVEAKPANPDGTLTTQSPVDDEDPANIRIGEGLPSIQLKKYVRLSTATGQGNDAQDSLHALLVKHGDTVTYRIEAKNTGSTALSNVVVEDHLPGCNLPTTPMSGDNGTTGLMEVGETWVYECNQASVTEDVYNLATVTAIPAYDNGTPTGQSPVGDEDPANVRIPLAEPSIELKKYARLSGAAAPGNDAEDALHALLITYGSNVTYRIEVRNTGSTALTNVAVEDSLPGCNMPTNPVGDDGDNLLEVGELWSYECTQTNVTTDVYNLGTVVAQPAHDDGTSTTQSPVTAQDAANVRLPAQQPALELKKYVRLEGTAAPGADAQDNLTALLVKHGANVVYRITVRNTGNAALGSVKVDDHLDGCSLAATPQSGDTNANLLLDPMELWVYECAQSNITTDVYNLATVVATPVNADGSPTGQSPITADDPANVRIPLAEPAISLKKYVVAGGVDNDAQDAGKAVLITSGSTVNYKIVVRNLGSAILGKVTVEDQLEDCTLSSPTGDAGGDGLLGIGEVWTYTCSTPNVRVDTENYATVTATPVYEDGTPTNQSTVTDGDPANVRIPLGQPAIELKKYVRPATAAAGSALEKDAEDMSSALVVNHGANVTYRMVVRNIGNTPLINVTLTEHMAGCTVSQTIGASQTILNPGTFWEYECSKSDMTADQENVADVQAQPANPDGTPTTQSPVRDLDPANVKLSSADPAITLKKYVVAGGVDNDAQDSSTAVAINSGSTVNYKVVVTNTGSALLGNVLVDDRLAGCTLSSPTGDTGNDGRMATGESWIYTCSVANVTADTYNLATVTATPINADDGTPTGQSPVSADDPANVKIRVQRPAIELKKYVVSGGDQDAQDMSTAVVIDSGSNVTYKIVVTNPGNAPLADVTVDDQLAGCTLSSPVITNNDGDNLLDSNETWTYTCTVSGVTTDLYNLATVEAKPANEDGTLTTQSPVNAEDPANVKVRVQRPAIELKKYVVSGGVDVDAQDYSAAVIINSGSNVTYKIVVTNPGNAPLADVTVDDQLEGCTLSGPAAGNDADHDTLLDKGETWVYSCTVSNVTTDLYNLATVEAKPANEDGTLTTQSPVDAEDPANVRIRLGQPAIELKKYVQDAATAPAFSAATPLAGLGNDAQDMSSATALKNGANALYRMVVTNIGNTPLAQVVLTEHLDSCTVSRLYNGDADVKDLLSPGEYWVYQCTKSNVTVDMQNVASVEAKPANPDGTLTTQSPVDDEDPANIRIGEGLPSIQLKKYVRLSTATGQGNDAQDSLHALLVKHGDTVTYRIEAKNTGSTALSNVVVEDHLPGCNLPTTPMSGDNGTTGLMEVGETWVYECNQASVTEDVYNLATVTAIPAYDNGTPTGQSPVGDEDPANVRIPLAEPSIELKKYARLSGAAAPGNDAEDALHALLITYGSNVTYRIEVRNTGSTALVNVAVEDSLPGCNMPTNPVGDDGDNLLEVGELWSYECTQTNVTTDVYNLGTVVAQPAHDDGTPTTQSPVMAQNAANVRIPAQQPAVELKKYVRLEGTAAPGNDAQDALTALLVKHGDNVVYRITVRNTGNTVLSNVTVDDHLAGCNLPANPQAGDNGNGLLDPMELWVYECAQSNITTDVYNLATVVATPANADGSPTGQSPITADDPANVRIPSTEPTIMLKKYVRLEGTAAATGLDAQDSSTALMVNHNSNVTYRIVVRNVGSTALDQVNVEDHLDNCALAPVDMGDLDAANILKQGETWIFECTQTGVKLDTYNLATVEARPIHDDGTPTGQSPVDAEDPANVLVRKTLPAISLKKYVRPQGAAAPGNDAQDALHALTVNYGSNVTYRIEVRNTGNAPLVNVKVEDHLDSCNLPANPSSGDTGNDGMLGLAEVWVYECDQTNVTTDVYNLATVEAVPANADGTPTNQSPVDAEDPANVHIQVNGPAITLKKYVQPATGAPAYDANTIATLGVDAQDTIHAQQLEFGQSALFRIVIKNTGTTWLDTVGIEDHLETCNPFNRIYTSVDNNDTMAPGEFWVYECTVPNVTENLANLATVEARPIQQDGTPTGQSPVDSHDMANVMIPVREPAIALKKYVRKVGEAAPGIDAQDNLHALTIAHGDSVIYNIAVRNVGDTVLGYINVDDRLDGCVLNPVSLADGDSLLGIGEVWTYECTQATVTEDVYNLATVTAKPVYADGTPTGQSPVNANDPANVRIPLDGPSISLKKYVQDNATAKAYVAGDISTMGVDAQDATTAAYVPYDGTALYRIAVQNMGNTWLDQVVVDDSLENCALVRIDRGDKDIDDTLQPGETWVYECTLAKVNEDVRNLATVMARPIHADLVPTNQSPVTASDPAHVTTELAPKIAIRKYAQNADGAPAYWFGDDRTLGYDAEDATAAAYIPYDGTALYRITVTNTGNTWLDQVVVDDQFDNCSLTNIDKVDGDDALRPGERWVYECTLANVREELRNTATVEARPINPDGTPTNQSPVDDSNVAHVTTELAPKIALKKYVQAANGAPTYDAADDATLGVDAQDVTSAAYIQYDGTALYRITVTNTGNTWLDKVVVDDQLDNCSLSNIDKGDGDDSLKPEERWVYECTQANITENIRNTATVEARPINPDGTPTNQSPVDDSDVAHVTTELAPKIALKKYVQAANGAPAYDAANDASLGVDAQDVTSAAYIQYDGTALYRITVTNTGNTWLDKVVVDDQLDNCSLSNIDKGDGDDSLKPAERWVYECTQANVIEDIRNTATVEARPINPDGTPTNQSPVDDSDVAHVTTEQAPKIAIRKYVQAATAAPSYDAADNATLGYDAEDATSAAYITYDGTALYRITVTNTGNTWLDQVVVDDQLDNCNLQNIDKGDGDDSLKPTERWVYECTLANIRDRLRNTATVEARPINPDLTPTNQSPVDDSNVAHVTTELAPKITLRKYAQNANGAPAYDAANDATLGQDAEDVGAAAYIPYDGTALYRITVTNTGNTWLDKVVVDDQLVGCDLKNIDQGDGNDTLKPEERWVYECTQANVIEDIRNTATVEARPINPDGTPTNQSPVDDSNVAHVTTELAPKIALKKYVQDANGALAYDAADDASLGQDAQDAVSATYIPYDGTALYRITVTNTGNTWLDTVTVDDQIAGCDLQNIDKGDGDDSLKPEERWVYECSLAKVNENVRNTATVEARPINPDLTPTNQSPVDDSDVANITTEPAPQIALKKYVQDATGAMPYDKGDDLSLGADAQDAATATFIPYDGTALYRITVTNTGNTWLDKVVVDDQLANCALASIDNGDGDDKLRPDERWVYECSLAKVNENVRNMATVTAHPVNPDGTPTNQSPVNASDVANITTEPAPQITLKTYVQDSNNAPAYSAANPVTLGLDAQDASTAAYIPYDKTALYRIVITNTGNTWLNQVVMDPNLENCANLTIIDKGDGDDSLRPTEFWVYECTLDKVNENVSNTATVTAHPVNPDGTPTNQSPVNASDPANITTEPAPAILLKKYAQPAATAKPYDAADDSTLGIDAQDQTGAAYIMYDASALYYITVTNTGNTWLKDIVVDDKLEGCDAQIVDQADGDAYLRPQERWVYTCQIDHVTQPVTNLATVQAYAINPDLTPTNQASVSSEDVANIRTHKGHSIGNYIWIDDGNGITANHNNGTVDSGEKPAADGVVLELNDASGNPVNLGNGALTTTTSSGYYLFSALPPGDYQVCVAASNFDMGGPLFGYLVSGFNESDPNADKDQNNNGLAPVGGKVCSGIITLDDNEPVKEFPTASGQAGNDAAGSEDTASNLTIDFGFVPQEVGVGNRLWIDEGVSTETTNNGIYDDGEAPLASVLVEVYKQGQDPDVDTPVSVTETDRFGCYSFEHLRAGTYFVHVPYYQSVLDGTLEIKPLYAYVSSKGDDGDPGVDDDQGENGIDQLATMELSGLMTSPFTLVPGQEPTGERQCGKTTPATLEDNSYDGTKDIGVLRYMQLGNYVWFDRNANGVQDANEVGIVDATVELFAADGVTPVTDIHGNPVAAVQTDAEGKYLFTSLVPGQYVVRVTPPQADYMVSPKSVADPNTDDNTDSNALAVDGQPYAQSGVVTLSYNDEPMHDGDLENPNSNLTVDFGFYIPVAVGDRVWLDHNGNGQQESEDLNISGATVSLFATDGVTPVTDAEGNPVADQTTGSDGLYLFDKLLEGEYVVKVKAPSEVYLPTKGGADPDDDASNTDSNALPLVDGVSSSLPVTLQVRSEPTDDNDNGHPRDSSINRSVDFGFIRPLAIGDFIWGDNNADGLQTDGETGLTGSVVTLLTTAGSPVIDLNGETVAPVTVDETGAYHFEMLIEGDYIVRVTPPEGFIASKARQGDDITHDSNCSATDAGLFQTPDMSLRFNQQPETSVDGDNSDRDMTVDCGFFHPVGVGNYIWMDTNGDGLQGSDEKGLADAKVELFAADGVTPVNDVNDQPVVAQTTGASGLYAFDHLMPGDYIVQVTPPEGFRATAGGADPDDEPSNMDSNCAAVGETFQTPAVTLFGLTEPETELDGDDTSHNSTVDCGFFRTATLGGRLWIDIDMDGKQTEGEPSLSDMQLTLTDASGQPVKDIFGEVVQPVKAAANGEYAFTNLMAGQYIVTAQMPPAYRATTGVADPNNDDDTDSNGYNQLEGYIASGVVDLSWDSEPVSEDGDPSTNLTIDFGFIPQVAIPTVSEWGLIIMSLMLMMAGVYWQRRRYVK